MTIEQFQNSKDPIHQGFQLVTDSQDVQPVLEYIGKTRTAKKHDIEGLFVKQKMVTMLLPMDSKERFLIYTNHL